MVSLVFVAPASRRLFCFCGTGNLACAPAVAFVAQPLLAVRVAVPGNANLPIGVVALALALQCMPRHPEPAEAGEACLPQAGISLSFEAPQISNRTSPAQTNSHTPHRNKRNTNPRASALLHPTPARSPAHSPEHSPQHPHSHPPPRH